METVIDRKVEELKETGVVDLERLNFRLSDAIREGCKVSDQSAGWVQGDNLCAMSAAVVAAKARGYMA